MFQYCRANYKLLETADVLFKRPSPLTHWQF
jgi:hypothetical protein